MKSAISAELSLAQAFCQVLGNQSNCGRCVAESLQAGSTSAPIEPYSLIVNMIAIQPYWSKTFFRYSATYISDGNFWLLFNLTFAIFSMIFWRCIFFLLSTRANLLWLTLYFLKIAIAAPPAQIRIASKKAIPAPRACTNSCFPEFVKVEQNF